MGYFCPKNTFLQVKHYIQRKIHHIPYVNFKSISHFSQQNSSVFFSSNITYFRQSSLSKSKCSVFPPLALKFTKFLMSVFKQKASFSSKFGLLFSVTLRQIFSQNFMCYLEKQHIKVQIFGLATSHIKIYQISDAISGAKSQFFFKLCIIFCIKTLIYFFTKTNRITYVISPATSQVSFKFCITPQCYDT